MTCIILGRRRCWVTAGRRGRVRLLLRATAAANHLAGRLPSTTVALWVADPVDRIGRGAFLMNSCCKNGTQSKNLISSIIQKKINVSSSKRSHILRDIKGRTGDGATAEHACKQIRAIDGREEGARNRTKARRTYDSRLR
jgi:hypothetical protein